MTDVFSESKRSWIMSRVKSADTAPEIKIRSLIHRMGFRFRLKKEGIPGKPDIVFPSKRKVIFVNGCFWHGHSCKRGKRIPKSNVDYWNKKISNNKKRDRRICKNLKADGWSYLIIWECQLKNENVLERRIRGFLTE